MVVKILHGYLVIHDVGGPLRHHRFRHPERSSQENLSVGLGGK